MLLRFWDAHTIFLKLNSPPPRTVAMLLSLPRRRSLRRSAELKEDAFAAFADEPSRPASTREPAVAEAESEEQPRSRGPASKRADKLRGEGSTPKRAREAIELGLDKFQQKQYQAAIDLFQLSLEVSTGALLCGGHGTPCCCCFSSPPLPCTPPFRSSRAAA